MTDLPTGTVTFLFTDVEGSTRLLQALGDRYAAVQDSDTTVQLVEPSSRHYGPSFVLPAGFLATVVVISAWKWHALARSVRTVLNLEMACTAEMLANSKVVLPRVGEYIHQLFRYCIETDWGRKTGTERE